MSFSGIRLYVINLSTIGVTTFVEIEMGLKILLLLVTIGYTLSKWINIKNNKNDRAK